MENDNKGVLFKNEKKREGKSDADYQGQITVDGKEYWLNAWLNTSKDGTKKYMALKVKLKEPKAASIADEVKKVFPGATSVESDEVPF